MISNDIVGGAEYDPGTGAIDPYKVPEQSASIVAIAGITPVADTFPYFTGSLSAASSPITADGRGLLACADKTAQRAFLNYEGTANTFTATQTFNKSGANAVIARVDSNTTTINTALAAVSLQNQDTTNNNFITLAFEALDSTPSLQTYGYVAVQVVDHTAASKTGKLTIGLQNAGAMVVYFTLSAGVGLVAFNMRPATDNTYDLGASNRRWTQIYGVSIFAGALTIGIVTKTATYTVTTGDSTILCNATGGAITINLPAAANNTGRIVRVKKIDASGNTVTIDANASETIDGATTKVLSAQWENVTIQCDGTGWFIF